MSTDSGPNSHTLDPWFAGIDVGGTSIKIGVISAAGQIVEETSIPTQDERGPEDAISRVRETLTGLLQTNGGERFLAAGLGTPGPLDSRQGMILDPVNMPGWRHYPIRDALSQSLGCPVHYANDANAAAWGEFWIGTAKTYDSLVLLTLGTGVGGGIVIDNQLVVGRNDMAAECGHSMVDFSEQARVCSCGIKGHLEAYASASAVAVAAKEMAAQCPSGELAKILESAGDLNAEDVYHCALREDPGAWQIIDQTAGFLARGIADLAHTVDPDIFLLGGAMNFGGTNSPVGQRFLDTIEKAVHRAVFDRIADNLKIEFASLGGSAGWIGAAGLAKRLYDQQT
ncbi:MAG: ROK family protein [Planctomycetaceae bacterium]|nr:ROK family protein [Planctomycetaceae bacterium]MCP4463531.1 ROK family protein [Planctomycetaceae bacterium]